jgi:hypothetical protein
MPNIDRGLWRRLIARQEKYLDTLARQQAERRLDEVEAHVQNERERRGLQPVVTDTGKIIAWVRTRPQSPGGR